MAKKLTPGQNQIRIIIQDEWKKLTGTKMPEIGDTLTFRYRGEELVGELEWYSCSFTDEGCHMDLTVVRGKKFYYHIWITDVVIGG